MNKKIKDKIPRKLSLVKFDFTDLPLEYHSSYPFIKEQRYLFLGEIANMPGHCAVIGDNSVTYFGYHTENFIELTEDEL